jgi:hypothetical protein
VADEIDSLKATKRLAEDLIKRCERAVETGHWMTSEESYQFGIMEKPE